MDHEVGLLADLDRSDPVGHADGLRSLDGQQLQRVGSAEGGGIHRDVLGQPGEDRRSAEAVDRVAGVLRVAPERDSAAALPQVEVPELASGSLAESQVGPRASGDGRGRLDDEVDLVVVEMHAVRDQQFGSEHAECGQVFDGTTARGGQVLLGVAGAGGEVERQPGLGLSGERRGRLDQFVGHQVVAHQRHPGRDQRTVVCVEHLALPADDFVDRAGEGPVLDVPSPGSQRDASADAACAFGDLGRVCDGAGLDRSRDPVADRLDERQGRGQEVVLGSVLGVYRHNPREDGLAWRQVVGDRRLDEPVAGEVLVGVDIPGQHEVVLGADDIGVRMAGDDLAPGPHVDDRVAADGHRAVADHGAAGIHRDDGASDDRRRVGHAVSSPITPKLWAMRSRLVSR